MLNPYHFIMSSYKSCIIEIKGKNIGETKNVFMLVDIIKKLLDVEKVYAMKKGFECKDFKAPTADELKKIRESYPGHANENADLILYFKRSKNCDPNNLLPFNIFVKPKMIRICLADIQFRENVYFYFPDFYNKIKKVSDDNYKIIKEIYQPIFLQIFKKLKPEEVKITTSEDAYTSKLCYILPKDDIENLDMHNIKEDVPHLLFNYSFDEHTFERYKKIINDNLVICVLKDNGIKNSEKLVKLVGNERFFSLVKEEIKRIREKNRLV